MLRYACEHSTPNPDPSDPGRNRSCLYCNVAAVERECAFALLRLHSTFGTARKLPALIDVTLNLPQTHLLTSFLAKHEGIGQLSSTIGSAGS